MGLNYKSPWVFLIKGDMAKGQLRKKTGIGSRAVVKQRKNENVDTDILRKKIRCPRLYTIGYYRSCAG